MLNLAAVVVSVIAMIPFLALYGSTHASQAGFEVAGWELLVAILVTLALTGAALVVHEWIHLWSSSARAVRQRMARS